jgi:putative transposase
LDADVARGLQLHHDWGPVPLGPLRRLAGRAGHRRCPAFLREPETNGCAERWIRTLKDQCLSVQLHDIIDPRQAVAGFVDRYNSSWLINGTATHPKEAYQAAQSAQAA